MVIDAVNGRTEEKKAITVLNFLVLLGSIETSRNYNVENGLTSIRNMCTMNKSSRVSLKIIADSLWRF